MGDLAVAENCFLLRLFITSAVYTTVMTPPCNDVSGFLNEILKPLLSEPIFNLHTMCNVDYLLAETVD